jgi:hypothetical protein
MGHRKEQARVAKKAITLSLDKLNIRTLGKPMRIKLQD